MVVKFCGPRRILFFSVFLLSSSSITYAFDLKKTINNQVDNLKTNVFDLTSSVSRQLRSHKQSTAGSTPRTATSCPPAFKPISSPIVKKQSEVPRERLDQKPTVIKKNSIFNNLTSCLKVADSTNFVHVSSGNYYAAVDTSYDLFYKSSNFYFYRDASWYISTDARCGYRYLTYQYLPIQFQEPIAKLRIITGEYYQKVHSHPHTHSLVVLGEIQAKEKQELDKEKKKDDSAKKSAFHSKHKKKHHSGGHHSHHHHH